MKRPSTLTKHRKRAIQKRLKVAKRHDFEIRQNNIARSSSKKPKNTIKRITIDAPEKICLYKRDTHQKLVSFIKELRKITLSNQIPVNINFQETNHCGASGMLLLLSEVDRIRRITNRHDLFKAIKVKDEKVRQIFKQTGFGEMLNFHDDIDVTRDDVKNWRFITGEGTEGSIVGALTEQLNTQIGEEISSEIYGAYVDAIDNVSSHAYLEPRHERDRFTEKRWWMFAEVIDGRFITAACDLGMGIPRSLPAEGFKEEVFEFLNKIKLKRTDAAYIRAAFELTRTKTKDPKHGKGLKRMRKIVDIIKEAQISIYSNSGLYQYTHRSDGTKYEEFYSTKNIMGTIVEWNVPLNMEEIIS